MKAIVRILFVLTLCLMVGCHWGTGFRYTRKEMGAFTVKLENPANPEEGADWYQLYELPGKAGEPNLYRMRIQSVYCSDSVCKVVPVDMYWNYLGEYYNYRLDKDFSLEKVRGQLFSKDEYRQLDRILHDKNSPFRTISIREIITSASSEGVDAVSGATVLALSDSVTVKGASLTCFSLWKWANCSDVQQKVRDHSGSKWSASQLGQFLTHDERHKMYAVEQLTRMKIQDSGLVEAVCDQGIRNMNVWSKLQVNYLRTLPDRLFADAFLSILNIGTSTQQAALLNDLLHGSRELSPEFWDDVVSLLPKYRSYQVVDLFLILMAKYNTNDEQMIDSVFSLLERDILIARRAYWFLQQEELTAAQKIQLKRFHQSHQEYL